MPLPNSYVQTGRMQDYFEAMLNAEPPSRFSTSFMQNLGFKSSNDRAFIGVLRELGFIDSDGKPMERYYQFLDKSQWRYVLAEGIRDAYSDLFAINKNADTMSREEVKNKLRSLYSGHKSDKVIGLIARTFDDLTEIGDFSELGSSVNGNHLDKDITGDTQVNVNGTGEASARTHSQKISVDALQYHINIVLPETRDQSVYDAIFRSLREHLG